MKRNKIKCIIKYLFVFHNNNHSCVWVYRHYLNEWTLLLIIYSLFILKKKYLFIFLRKSQTFTEKISCLYVEINTITLVFISVNLNFILKKLIRRTSYSHIYYRENFLNYGKSFFSKPC